MRVQLKTFGILCQSCKYKLALDANNFITDFNADNPTTDSFKIE